MQFISEATIKNLILQICHTNIEEIIQNYNPFGLNVWHAKLLLQTACSMDVPIQAVHLETHDIPR